MDNLNAFAMGMANRGKPTRVFDWVGAAKLIVERKPDVVSAGLAMDWEYTGGVIYRSDGVYDKWDIVGLYLESTWAVPEIDIDGDVSPCWVWTDKSPGWGADTFWPEEARAVLTAAGLTAPPVPAGYDGP